MPGPRVFTVDEANELVPTLQSSFDAIDEHREQLRVLKIKLHALEMIWGPELAKPDCPDHQEGKALIDQLNEEEQAIAAVVQELNEEGVVVKDVQSGLADVYHVRDGVLVHLCWQRGEDAIEAWHHVDEGFDDRQGL